MSTLETNLIRPSTGTSLTIGESGDTTNIVGTLQNNGAGVGGDNAPFFLANLSSNQSVTSNAVTKINFNNEIADPNGVYDHTSNYRFTPASAGYYMVNINLLYTPLGQDIHGETLRIYINDELNELKDSLFKVKDLIQKNGVIICISYHSLEDRIIKNFMKDLTLGCICDPSIAICVCNNIQNFEYPKRKKYYPNKEEINSNSRANSATLRYVRKI